MENDSKSNKNLLALLIGLVGIAVIGGYTVWHPFARPPENNIGEQANEEQGPLSGNSVISDSELLNKVRNRQKIAIIDVRDEVSFANEHIADAKNIPLEKFASDSNSLNPIAAHILVDETGDAAMTYLVDDLQNNKGFADIKYLSGGFAAWKEKNNPTVSAGNPDSLVDQSKVSYLNSDDLKKIMEEESNLYIIDVRSNSQFTEGHLKNAVNIFLDDLEKQRDKIPAGKKIILYDNDGLWAFQGAVRLFDLNFFNTYALSDGLNAWKNKGFEIVK